VGSYAVNGLDLIVRSLPLLCKGVVVTVQLLVCSSALSFSLGAVCGMLCSDRLKVRFLSPCIEAITFVFRGVPFFVQLLIIYFVLPDLLGFNLHLFPASVLALGLCSSGYVAQLVRTGFNAVPASQWEAAFTLGYTKRQAVWYIILPQTVRQLLGPLNNELDSLLKSTAITSSIGMLELTRMGMNVVSREMEPVPIYLAIAVFYLLFSALINLFSRYLERKFQF